MPRTDLTKITAPGSIQYTGTVLTMTAADVANMNQFTASGKDLIIAHNTGASPYTVTVTSIADPYGRTKDIAAQSLAAGEYRVFGPMETVGWTQTDGKIYLQASNASVKFGVIAL